MARVVISQNDGDWQGATVRLIHDANVEIDKLNLWLPGRDRICAYLQAGFVSKGKETITLQCNTYDGLAKDASIIAFNVGDIEFQ
jgi:hypothetical protein